VYFACCRNLASYRIGSQNRSTNIKKTNDSLNNGALKIFKHRYATGKIDQFQYEAMKKELQ